MINEAKREVNKRSVRKCPSLSFVMGMVENDGVYAERI
jgi:hypothetical protein